MAVLILTRLSARSRTEAHHDDLTGVLNRAGFFIEAARRRAMAARQAAPVALIIIDLDGFELVNDHHGHAARLYEAKGARRAGADRHRAVAALEA